MNKIRYLNWFHLELIMSIWEPLLNNSEFNKQIEENGYSKEIRFIDYIKENKLEKLIQRTGAITAQMLSIDF